MSHLVGAGHRRIAYVGGATTVHTGAQRLAGYKQCLNDAGIEIDASVISMNNHDTDMAGAAVRRLLTGPQPPTAIFTDNNRMTVGALKAIHELGATADIAGFDDVELAGLLTTPVTLVIYDVAELCRQAAELLFARIAGDDRPPRRVTLPTTVEVHQ